jgi:2-methylcitrate dehydratase
MTLVEQLARFSVRTSYDDLSDAAREQLKIRLLDGLACAIGAMDAEPMRLVRAQVAEFDASGPCSLIGGGSAAPDRAAFCNSGLIRYLDFNDSYLAPGESCQPSDSLGPVLAAAEYAGASGRDFLAALALAYQVQCRLSDVAPVRDAGFDHVTQGAYAAATGCARVLGLGATETAHAIAIAGTASNALRVARTGRLSHWTGLAGPNAGAGALRAALLARRGITGPLEVFEGEKGFMDAIAGYFTLDWEAEDLERVTRTILKRYDADIHAQSALEALLTLCERERIVAADVERVEVDIFDVGYRVIGGGEEGDKMVVRTKEDADQSLPYLLAVALLDGDVSPAQFLPSRIRGDDVQGLLRRVTVHPDEDFSRRFPGEMPCRVRLYLRDGRGPSLELADYPGFRAGGQTWDVARQKFDRLAAPYMEAALRDGIIGAVAALERTGVAELTQLLDGAARPLTSGPRSNGKHPQGRDTNMDQRVDYGKAAPEGTRALRGLEDYVRQCGLEPGLLDLVRIRASQLNGCAYCIDMHTKDARAGGESEQRLYGLSAWRETPFYTDRERAALAWTEAVTLIAGAPVPDRLYEEARLRFSERELVDLTLALVAINGWNRLSIAFRTVPGSYQPKRGATGAQSRQRASA